jgi:hypothetical protein
LGNTRLFGSSTRTTSSLYVYVFSPPTCESQ